MLIRNPQTRMTTNQTLCQMSGVRLGRTATYSNESVRLEFVIIFGKGTLNSPGFPVSPFLERMLLSVVKGGLRTRKRSRAMLRLTHRYAGLEFSEWV